jgi:hypothetical protein
MPSESVKPAAPSVAPALSALLGELDKAITNAESLKKKADATAKAATEAQTAYDASLTPVRELQTQLGERLGLVLGANAGRTRGA